MNQRALAITKAYVFESDDESHINANELSDLSDVFDEDDDHSLTDIERGAHIPSSSISLDDIPYDRDLKYINVPTNARPRGLVQPSAVRMLKSVDAITSGTANSHSHSHSHSHSDPNAERRRPERVSVRRRPDGGEPAPKLLHEATETAAVGAGGAEHGKKDEGGHRRPPPQGQLQGQGQGHHQGGRRGGAQGRSQPRQHRAHPLPHPHPHPHPQQMVELPPQPPLNLNPFAQAFVPAAFLSR